MSILNDKDIIARCTKTEQMISPFISHNVANSGPYKSISYGLSSYGYDIRPSEEALLIPGGKDKEIDPKSNKGLWKETSLVTGGDGAKYFIIPPHGFVLGKSLEHLIIPRDILVVCLGKSTYARCGLIVNVTPLEPEWEGHITMEFSNTTDMPVRLYANEGCAQLIFHKADSECIHSYADKDGKYQHQKNITLGKV